MMPPMGDPSVARRRGRPHHRRTVEVVGLDHVQLAMPKGEEALARLFYGGLIGLQEVRKPRQLARRGGVWFVGPGIAVHLGVETPFRAAAKAHPAFVVRDLERALEQLAAHEIEVEEDDADLPVRRCYVSDPFGNRIELVDSQDAGFSHARRLRREPTG
jgi:catechol 2,3-dioxygenase-like lactoylglutathione lyase family enzyme